MIKLIVSDLDGTLLDSSGNLNSEFNTVFEQISAKGIKFAAASGRQYHNIAEKFADYKDRMVIIAENGSYMKENNNELLSITIEKEQAIKVIEIVRKLNNDTAVFLCGKNSAYIEDSRPGIMKAAKIYFTKYKIVDDLTLIDDDFLKISICNLNNNANEKYQYFIDIMQEVQVTLGSEVWIDVFSLKADKSVAVKKLQETYNITPDETMVFGDYLNDLGMIKSATHSYAMANAHPEIIKLAKNTAKSNNENGVIEIIKETILK